MPNPLSNLLPTRILSDILSELSPQRLHSSLHISKSESNSVRQIDIEKVVRQKLLENLFLYSENNNRINILQEKDGVGNTIFTATAYQFTHEQMVYLINKTIEKTKEAYNVL